MSCKKVSTFSSCHFDEAIFNPEKGKKKKKWETLILKMMWVASMFCACFGFLTLKDFIEFRAFNQYIHFIVYIIYYFYYHSSIVAVLIITLKLQFILSNSLNHKEFSMWMVLRQSWRQLRFTSDIGCLNISSEKYEKPKNDSLPWYCSNCAIKIASSTVFNTNPI